MLTEDRDELSGSSGHIINNTTNTNRPKRNVNTRRAIKDTRTSEKALRGNSELDTGCDNQNVARYIQQQNDGSENKKQIELGDYILPPDKKEETLGGIKSCKTTEYADPYETKQIMEALKARGPKGIRYSALPESPGPRFSSASPNTERSLSVPVDSSHDFVYDLAKPLDDEDFSSKSNKDFRHTYCEGNTPVSGTSVDSGVEDPDEYDHTLTWMTNGKNKMAQVIPNPCKTEPDQKDKQFCGQNPLPSCQDQVYAGPYEDPWDSSGSKQKFDDIITKAKKEYRKTSHSDDYEEPVVSSTYEEAWDLKSKEQDLENTVQEAHRRMSEGQQNLRVQRPRKNYDYFEPWNAPKTHEQNLKDYSPTKLKNGKPADLVYSDAYEDPWDIKQREREEALEKQFTNVHSPKSPKDEVPNFPAPPPPKSQTYEEAWERSQSSHVPSRSPHNSGHSPNQRRYTDGQRPGRADFAERIDPNLPLDIQPFYHGKIARKNAEDLLRIHKEGSYLVRRSETQANVFSLSLKGIGGMPMHLRISLESGLYILGENSKPFPTVPEMIDFYTRNELPVLKADRIKLLHPIPRHY